MPHSTSRLIAFFITACAATAIAGTASPTAVGDEPLPAWFGGFTGPAGTSTAASDAAPAPVPTGRPSRETQKPQDFHDWGQGLSWYEREADAGDADVQYRLGEILASGLIGEPDLEGARRWFDAAARQGHAQAQYRLATMLQRGEGGTADTGAAAEWYMSAALADVAPAAFNLAIMLDGGVGVPADPGTAARLYGMAARAGIGEAATNLALLYLQGRGVPKDEVYALSWLTVAAQAGVPGADQALGDLAETLDASEQQAAAELAKSLVAP